ncbi:MAG: hypothetical protein WC443_07195, partial [Desulfobaccales bacterium]
KFGPEDSSRQIHAAFLEALLTNEIQGFKPHRRGVSIKHAVVNDYVNLRSAEVPMAVELVGCRFQGGLNFSYCSFKKSLSLEQSHLKGWTNFNGMKVESDTFLNGAVFADGASFEGVALAGRLSAREARFEHPKLGPNFSTMQVGSDVDFQGAVFRADAFCSRMRIQGNFSLFKASFEGLVFFEGSDIGGNLNAIQASFANPKAPVYLTNVRVGQRGFFTNLVCPAGISMAMAHFLDLFVGSTDPAKPLAYQQIILDYAVVDRVCDLRNLLLDSFSAKKFTGKDLVWLDNVQVKNDAHLESGGFQTLMLIKVDWPAKQDHVWLDGMTYQNISSRNQVNEEAPEDWMKLLRLVNISNFDTQNYVQLEAYFQRRGEKGRADTVYIDGKRREIMQKWWHPYNLATLVFWDGLAGYGKKPARTLWVGLLIVCIGMLVFDHRNFDPSFLGGWTWLLQGNRYKTMAVRFFLSLDEFLPGVDLGLAKLWHLEKISFPTLLYYHFHKISGWVLIPIGLAAVLTQFKG